VNCDCFPYGKMAKKTLEIPRFQGFFIFDSAFLSPLRSTAIP
jgi:hypothetical protein